MRMSSPERPSPCVFLRQIDLQPRLDHVGLSRNQNPVEFSEALIEGFALIKIQIFGPPYG